MPRDGHSSDDRVLLAIPCPHCEAYTEKYLAWLSTASQMTCDTCGADVDVETGDSRYLIDTFVALNRRLDAEFSSL